MRKETTHIEIEFFLWFLTEKKNKQRAQAQE